MANYKIWFGCREMNVPKKYLEQASEMWKEHDVTKDIKNSRRKCFVVALNSEDNVVGYARAEVFPGKNSPSNCYYHENSFRMYWITHLKSIEKGVGTKLLSMCEDFLREVSKNYSDSRKNFYILSIASATGFYYKNGYVAITTPDHKEDHDYPSTTINSDYQIWVAKPIYSNQKLDREERYKPSITCTLILGLPEILDITEKEWKDFIIEDLKYDFILERIVPSLLENFREDVVRKVWNVLENIIEKESIPKKDWYDNDKSFYEMCLHSASLNEKPALEWFYSTFKEFSATPNKLLLKGAKLNNTSLIQFALDEGANEYNTALIVAALHRKKEIIDMMLSIMKMKGIAPAYRVLGEVQTRNTLYALQEAAAIGSIEIFKILTKKYEKKDDFPLPSKKSLVYKANISKRYNLPMQTASKHGQEEMVVWLLSKMKEKNITPVFHAALESAAKGGQTKMVIKFLDKVEPGFQRYYYFSLKAAKKAGHKETAEVLENYISKHNIKSD